MTDAIPAYDAAVDAPKHHHPVYDYDSGPPVDRGKFAIWVFLGTEIMFFTGLIGTYIVLRAGSPSWPNPAARLAVDITAFNTFVLICSSATVVAGLFAIQNDDRRKFNLWWGLSILFGAFFVGVQVYEYWHLFAHDMTPNQDLFWSTFYVMTGFHGAHVIIGVIWLAAVYVAALRGKYSSKDFVGLELAGLYWHFVDLVWVLLFTLVYLM
ncbi:MAG: heme-copper oxidase subunit III [Planctomycetes bacterium]|nr:heme-copper oxidase subunit III [Planctomycetota bacterium]MDA0946932.1 cytochrome c oxidase subunit 3 [Planctomycetota bacterium]